MRIGIDCRLALEKRRGISRYLLNLLNGIKKINDNKHEYFLYIHRPDLQNILPSDQCFIKKVIPYKPYPIWEQILLPKQCLMDNIDLLFCPANTAPLFIPKSCKLVLTLHDVIFIKYKQGKIRFSNLYQYFGNLYRRICINLIKDNIDSIITPSEFSKQDIAKTLKIPENKINVIPNSIDEIFLKPVDKHHCQRMLNEIGIRYKYILNVGGLSPNKGTLQAIKAFAELIKDEEFEDLNLVIVGIDNKTTNNIINFVIKKNLDSKVHFLYNLSDDLLKCLYYMSELLLFTSFYEGFGYPPLEAMACNTPVVASNLTSIPEVVGDAGILVNPTDLDAIVQAIKLIMNRSDLREKLVKRGMERVMNYVNEFSTVKNAARHIAIFESLIKS